MRLFHFWRICLKQHGNIKNICPNVPVGFFGSKFPDRACCILSSVAHFSDRFPYSDFVHRRSTFGQFNNNVGFSTILTFFGPRSYQTTIGHKTIKKCEKLKISTIFGTSTTKMDYFLNWAPEVGSKAFSDPFRLFPTLHLANFSAQTRHFRRFGGPKLPTFSSVAHIGSGQLFCTNAALSSISGAQIAYFFVCCPHCIGPTFLHNRVVLANF